MSHVPGSAPIPCSTVSLRISAKKLKNKDTFSVSDPMCVVSRLDGRLTGQTYWTEVGRSETIQNDLNPEWSREFEMQYFFEEKQTLRFDIYDVDSESRNLANHDFLGRLECDLAEIVSSGCLTKKLTGLAGDCGSITVFSEEKDDGRREAVSLKIYGRKLDRKDFLGKTDPYLKFYRLLDNGQRVLVHRTEFIRQTLNPAWLPFEISTKTLCSGNREQKILVECWDDDDDDSGKACISMMCSANSHDFVGSCEFSLAELAFGPLEKPLINERKQKKKGRKYKNSGVLYIGGEVITIYSFLDYISGGTQLDFTIAVDFTASNGDVSKPDSLHYIMSGVPNQYEVAIRAVLDVCQFYNNSKVFDAFGFGAIVPPGRQMIPIFSLANPSNNMNIISVQGAVAGVDGVLAAYRNSLHKVMLYGPTNFAPLVQKAAAQIITRSSIPGARYQVLLIITDGAICDMAQTISAIVKASSLPLSIIIVGVGNADFSAMDELDGDDVRLCSNGVMCERDIVQFVPMRQFTSSAYGQVPSAVMAHLAKEILAEVPSQLTSYMKSRNIVPRPSSNPFITDAPVQVDQPQENVIRDQTLPDAPPPYSSPEVGSAFFSSSAPPLSISHINFST